MLDLRTHEISLLDHRIHILILLIWYFITTDENGKKRWRWAISSTKSVPCSRVVSALPFGSEGGGGRSLPLIEFFCFFSKFTNSCGNIVFRGKKKSPIATVFPISVHHVMRLMLCTFAFISLDKIVYSIIIFCSYKKKLIKVFFLKNDLDECQSNTSRWVDRKLSYCWSGNKCPWNFLADF